MTQEYAFDARPVPKERRTPDTTNQTSKKIWYIVYCPPRTAELTQAEFPRMLVHDSPFTLQAGNLSGTWKLRGVAAKKKPKIVATAAMQGHYEKMQTPARQGFSLSNNKKTSVLSCVYGNRLCLSHRIFHAIVGKVWMLYTHIFCM